MDATDSQSLPFPEGFDPGDGALDLQVLAEAIDANATLKLAEFRRIANKPVRVSRLTGTGSGIPAGIKTDIFSTGAGNWVSQYNSPGMTVQNNALLNDQIGLTPGLYHFGAFLITNPTGAVNVNSQRLLTLEALIPNDPTSFPGTTIIKEARTEVFETNTGSTMMTAELEVFTPYPSSVSGDPFAGTDFNAYLTHANAGSTVTLLTGSLMWLYRAADMEG